jgi:hypothetical protein
LIFRKFEAGELEEDSGLGLLAKQCEINVDEVGVGGAKDFFEAKVSHPKFAQHTQTIPIEGGFKNTLYSIMQQVGA